MKNDAVHLDFETCSVVDLVKAGVYRYAEDKDTYVWGFRFRFGNSGPVEEWRPGYPDPVRLLEHIAQGKTVVVHNAAFERTVWNWIIVGRYCRHWPTMTIQQQDCTMSRAAAIAHPQSLEKLVHALNASVAKDMEGSALMKKMAKPRAFNADGTITWWGSPENVDRLMQYCGVDVEAETGVDELVPPLSAGNRATWEFDQLINDRGVRFDMPLVRRAASLVEYAKKQNDRVMRDITDRTVPKCSNDAKIIAWLNSRGVECTSLAKGEIEDVVFMAGLTDDEKALEAIALRKAAWKTSTAKYAAMAKCANVDDRIRGLLNWHGASTGRWAGRLVQPQNFPRVDSEDEFLQGKIAYLHDLLGSSLSIPEVYEYLVVLYGPLEPLQLLSQALRSMIVAAHGKKFISADFSNIEGRGNAWLANEMWKLAAFKAYDDGEGPDLYKLAYASAFGIDVAAVTKFQRQLGKVMELALGYQGGVGAFLTMGATYGLNPYSLTEPVQAATSADQWDRTMAQYYSPGTKRLDLQAPEWTAIKILVDNWRAANPAIVQSWWNYQDAAIEAVAAPGTVVHPKHTNRIAYYSDGRCLWCVLPSGRLLCYASPMLVEEYVDYYDKVTGEKRQRLKRKVTFMGTDSRTHQWVRQSMYGGLQCENIVQALSADIMIEAMFRVEDAGYNVILTVHDEILTEVDGTRSDLNEHDFAKIMSAASPTYAGLPISVGAWEDTRYVK